MRLSTARRCKCRISERLDSMHSPSVPASRAAKMAAKTQNEVRKTRKLHVRECRNRHEQGRPGCSMVPTTNKREPHDSGFNRLKRHTPASQSPPVSSPPLSHSGLEPASRWKTSIHRSTASAARYVEHCDQKQKLASSSTTVSDIRPSVRPDINPPNRHRKMHSSVYRKA